MVTVVLLQIIIFSSSLFPEFDFNCMITHKTALIIIL